jgi:hypothetical protein
MAAAAAMTYNGLQASCMDETARLSSQLHIGKAFSDEDKEKIPPNILATPEPAETS